MRVCICMTHSQPRIPSCRTLCASPSSSLLLVTMKGPFVCLCQRSSQSDCDLHQMGKIVRMHWNSMVPMAWAPTDRGTLTQPERTNQSYLRRLGDQDNNHVIERGKKKNSPTLQSGEMTEFLQMAHCCHWMSHLSGWALYNGVAWHT